MTKRVRIQPRLKKIAWFMWEIAWVLATFLLFTHAIVSFVFTMLPGSVIDGLSTMVGNIIVFAIADGVAACIVMLPFFFRRFRPKHVWSFLGIGMPVQGSMFAWALFLFGIYLAGSLCLMMVVYLLHIPGVDLSQVQQNGFEGATQWYEYVAAFITLVCLAPIFEELIFRGYLFGRLRSVAGFWPSAIATSLVFAIAHKQLNVGVDVFALSMCMCVAREHFRSIYPTILMHMLKNGLAFSLLFIWPLWQTNILRIIGL